MIGCLPNSLALSAIYIKGMKKPVKQRNPLKESKRNDGLISKCKSNISVKVDIKQPFESFVDFTELMVAFDCDNCCDNCCDDFSFDSFTDLIELNFVLLSNV